MSRPQKAYDKALVFLKIRPHHSGELAQKLALRKYEREEIDQVIRELRAEGLLNDAQYAESYAQELIRNKSYGYYMLMAKLQQRGIPKLEAENLLAANFSPEKELEIARRVAGRERGTDKIKLAQKLSRRGFRSQIISQIIHS